MKKVLSLFMVFVFGLLIVSCASSKKEETTASTTLETTEEKTEPTTETEDIYDEQGRIVVDNANSLMSKLDMGIRVTNVATNPKYYIDFVDDKKIGMITFDYEGVEYTFKGSKEVKDFKELCSVDGTVVNFYLFNIENKTSSFLSDIFYMVNQYGENGSVIATVITWKAYEGTANEAWYSLCCMDNISENIVRTLLSTVVGM